MIEYDNINAQKNIKNSFKNFLFASLSSKTGLSIKNKKGAVFYENTRLSKII